MIPSLKSHSIPSYGVDRSGGIIKGQDPHTVHT